MEILETTVLLPDEQKNIQTEADRKFEEKFVPKGAIAFFVLLVLLGLVIWYGIYFLMLDRI
jgi:hypothetical protein